MPFPTQMIIYKRKGGGGVRYRVFSLTFVLVGFFLGRGRGGYEGKLLEKGGKRGRRKTIRHVFSLKVVLVELLLREGMGGCGKGKSYAIFRV